MAPTASQMAPLRGDKRWAYLSRAKTIRLASINEDGSIYLTPLWFVVDDQKIYIPVDAGSRHGANAAAGRTIGGLVDSGDEFATVAGVRLAGALEEVTDADEVEKLQRLVFEKYFYVDHPYAEAYFEFGRRSLRISARRSGWIVRPKILRRYGASAAGSCWRSKSSGISG